MKNPVKENIEQQILNLIEKLDSNIDKNLIEGINKKISEKLEEEKTTNDIIKLLDNFDNIEQREEIKRIREEITKKVIWKTTIPQIFFKIVAIFAFATFLYFILTSFISEELIFDKTISIRTIRVVDFILYSIWAIGPPTYFLIEYLRIFPYKLDSNQLTDFKYTQELSSKIWAALLLIFGIILLKRYG